MRFNHSAIAAALLAATCASHAAEQYPSKVIRMIVPLAPGGTGDTLARTVGAADADVEHVDPRR